MKKFYFKIDHPSIKVAEIRAENKQDALIDLQFYIKSSFGMFSPVKIKGIVPRPENCEFWHQYNDPEWVRLGRNKNPKSLIIK